MRRREYNTELHRKDSQLLTQLVREVRKLINVCALYTYTHNSKVAFEDVFTEELI